MTKPIGHDSEYARLCASQLAVGSKAEYRPQDYRFPRASSPVSFLEHSDPVRGWSHYLTLAGAIGVMLAIFAMGFWAMLTSPSP